MFCTVGSQSCKNIIVSSDRVIVGDPVVAYHVAMNHGQVCQKAYFCSKTLHTTPRPCVVWCGVSGDKTSCFVQLYKRLQWFPLTTAFICSAIQ